MATALAAPPVPDSGADWDRRCAGCGDAPRRVSERLSERIRWISPTCLVREYFVVARYVCRPCGLTRVVLTD